MTPLETIADGCLGRTFADRYEVERILGVGGVGFVLAATHKLTGRKVALKVVPGAEGAGLERLLLEARAPALVDHPNVIDVYDVGYDEPTKAVFLVEEHLDGHDLRDELTRRGTIPWSEAIALLAPGMSALCAAHRIGLVHRDVKAENIFLARDRSGKLTIKVLDFGIARLVSRTTRQTTEGAVMGSVHTMSPEQACGQKDIDAQTDVWAAAICLFECIAGYAPFDGDLYNEVLVQVISAPVPRLDLAEPSVPKAVADVIERALTRDRKLRYRTMDAMLAALLSAAGMIPMQVSGPPESSFIEDATTVAKVRLNGHGTTEFVTAIIRKPQKPHPQSRPVIAATVIILACVAILAGWHRVQGPRTVITAPTGAKLIPMRNPPIQLPPPISGSLRAMPTVVIPPIPVDMPRERIVDMPRWMRRHATVDVLPIPITQEPRRNAVTAPRVEPETPQLRNGAPVLEP